MSSDNDILVELNKDDITKLKETYKAVPDAFHVYTLLDVCERWYGKGDMTVTSPGDAWKQDGSIVVFIEYVCTAIFPYSLDPNYERIMDGFLKTRRLDSQKPILFINLFETYVDKMVNVMQKMNRKVEETFENNFYFMPINKAKSLHVECPEGTYIDRLKVEHAEQMNRVWPHRFENSNKAVASWLQKNFGYGLFLKENGKLVSWAMQGYLGHINLLQTEEEYKGRGYAQVMVLQMAKHLAESGHIPSATAITKNTPSNSLFRKLGFESNVRSYFIFMSSSDAQDESGNKDDNEK